MRFNNLTRLLSVSALAVGLVASPLASASFADTTGGGSGGGNGGSSSGDRRWVSLAYNNSSKAYPEFLKKTGYSKAVTEDLIRAKGASVEVCKKSNVIWWLQNKKTGGWSHNWTGATNGSAWRGDGTIQNPAKKYGDRAPTVAEYNTFLDWDKKNGRNLNKGKGQGYTVICSGVSTKPTIKTPESPKTTTEGKVTKDEDTFTKPYTYVTTVTPQTIKGGKIGRGLLETQPAKTVKTNFGKLWDDLNRGKTDKTASQIKKEVNAAVKKDKTLTHAKVNLNANNKNGLADGGVLNINEQMKQATISTKSTTVTTITVKCWNEQTWNANKGEYNKAVKKCDPKDKGTKKNITTTSISKSKESTQKNTGFWQILSVHCNPEEFEALLNATSGEKVISEGNPEKGVAAVVYSKKYSQQPAAGNLDFGDASNSNKAKAKTGNLGFYNKECAFDCTPGSTGSNAEKNGASNNVVKKGFKDSDNGELYGAKSGNSNSNKFSFFRDNRTNEIVADVWYPKNTTAVKYDGHKALTTTITRDPNGTPGINSSTGGSATVTDSEGKKLFTGTGKVKPQMNWDTSTFNSPNSTIRSGLVNKINLQSTWASEPNKPHAFNFKYEYAPKVYTNVPVKNIGFGENGAQERGDLGKVSADIQGKCYANFGTDKQQNMSSQISKNTGSGTTNNLDTKIINNDKLKVIANFVRSTTE